MMLFFLEICVITECRVLIALGSEASLMLAMEKLGHVQQNARAWQNTCQQVEVMILRALGSHFQGQLEAGVSILEEAVTLASPGGWIRPFVEIGPVMETLLEQLSAKKTAMPFMDQVLAAFKQDWHSTIPAVSDSPDPVAPYGGHTISQPLIDPLTRRELEILELLAQHLYNKEIAEKLYISPETVKTHLKRIYEKLEVGSRRDAVTKAEELDLFTCR